MQSMAMKTGKLSQMYRTEFDVFIAIVSLLVNCDAFADNANICATHSCWWLAPAARAPWWNRFSTKDRRMDCLTRCGRHWTLVAIIITGSCLGTRRLPSTQCPWCMRESIVFSTPSSRASIMRLPCWGIDYANWDTITTPENRLNTILINTMKSLNWSGFTFKLISSIKSFAILMEIKVASRLIDCFLFAEIFKIANIYSTQYYSFKWFKRS